MGEPLIRRRSRPGIEIIYPPDINPKPIENSSISLLLLNLALGLSHVGIVFTMPDVLWPIFRHNRHLLHDLPKLGAAVIQQWVKIKCGVRVLIMVIPHTFGGRSEFQFSSPYPDVRRWSTGIGRSLG